MPVRIVDDTAIVAAMATICDAFGHHGWRRVQAALPQNGLHVNHKTVCRLMREPDLQPKMHRRVTKSSDGITISRSSRILQRR